MRYVEPPPNLQLFLTVWFTTAAIFFYGGPGQSDPLVEDRWFVAICICTAFLFSVLAGLFFFGWLIGLE